MARDWEDSFRFWGRSPSETERTKCENAERAIRKAILADETLSKLTLAVIPQGSYRNRTNVRQDSDVDICICCKDVIFPQYPDQTMTLSDVGLSPATYTYSQFKADVEKALRSYFGNGSVNRGKKAFDVHENTYRIDSDVVAAFEHRRYTMRGLGGQWLYISGTQFSPDDGGEVINWPEQQYTNGVRKNDATGKRYKAMARILKNLRNEMVENGNAAAKPISSFLLECLAFNVPNHLLMAADYKRAVEASISHLYQSTTSFDNCGDWGEVNELKYLFRGNQPWTFQQVNDFTVAAWNYVGFSS